MLLNLSAGLLAVSVLAAAQPAFEVASVKRSPADDAGFSISPSGAGTFTARKITLDVLIGMAFGMTSERVSGKQNWMSSEYYDITARPEGDQGLSYQQLRPMLQQLLVERFKLSFHRETKDAQGYALVVAKTGPKLQATKGAPSRPALLKGGLRADNISIRTLAAMLAKPAGRPVVDQTGIDGNFDITLDYAPEGATDSSLPSIFTALQEQLGLRLVPQKVPVETLVIDHAERVPIEN
jgi:uncharacterized protein (TIGR03435 family)